MDNEFWTNEFNTWRNPRYGEIQGDPLVKAAAPEAPHSPWTIALIFGYLHLKIVPEGMPSMLSSNISIPQFVKLMRSLPVALLKGEEFKGWEWVSTEDILRFSSSSTRLKLTIGMVYFVFGMVFRYLWWCILYLGWCFDICGGVFGI